MILRLFLAFLKIGAVSFGGGYGMIPLIRETVLESGWLTEETFLDLIAVAESTPGPIAVNMATFIGSSKAGIPGALAATLGVVLPSSLITLLIASVMQNLMKYAGVGAFLGGVRPAIAGMTTATGLTMLLSVCLGITGVTTRPAPDLRAVFIFLAVALTAYIGKKKTGKKVSPILLILLSAVLGIALYYLPTIF